MLNTGNESKKPKTSLRSLFGIKNLFSSPSDLSDTTRRHQSPRRFYQSNQASTSAPDIRFSGLGTSSNTIYQQPGRNASTGSLLYKPVQDDRTPGSSTPNADIHPALRRGTSSYVPRSRTANIGPASPRSPYNQPVVSTVNKRTSASISRTNATTRVNSTTAGTTTSLATTTTLATTSSAAATTTSGDTTPSLVTTSSTAPTSEDQSSSSSCLEPVSTKVLLQDLRKSGSPRILAYMTSKIEILNMQDPIMLWNVEPRRWKTTADEPSRNGLESQRAIELGDVGYFTASGHFQAICNLFSTEEENKRLLGLSPSMKVPAYAQHNLQLGDIVVESSDMCWFTDRKMRWGDPVQQPHNPSSYPLRLPTSHASGSALITPSGITVESAVDFMQRPHFKETYVKPYVDGWYRHCEGLVGGFEGGGGICVVSERCTAKTWGLVCISTSIQKTGPARVQPITAVLSRIQSADGSGDSDQYQWTVSAPEEVDVDVLSKVGPNKTLGGVKPEERGAGSVVAISVLGLNSSLHTSKKELGSEI